MNISGCSRTARDKINMLISEDLAHVPKGRDLSGNIMNLSGVEHWTSSDSSCLNIEDMDLDREQELEVTGLVEADSDDEDDSDDDEEN